MDYRKWEEVRCGVPCLLGSRETPAASRGTS
jgi:hypothetical protein